MREDFVNTKKPPLGLEPRFIHDQRRILEILAAMDRYVSEGLSIKDEWMQELRDLHERNSI